MLRKERSRRFHFASRRAGAVLTFGNRRASLFTATAVASIMAVACSPRTRAPEANAPAPSDLVKVTSALGISPATWTAEGAFPGAARPPVDSVTKPDAFAYEVSGSVHCLLVDPANPATVYAGGAGGGVFKADGSTGIGVDSASVLAGTRVHWVATSDGMPSLSVSAMAMDPSNRLHIVVGTGSVSNFGAHGVQGLIYVTTDGGLTWTPVTNTPMRGRPISGLAVRGQFVLATVASNSGGVFASSDGGLTWEDRTGLHPSDPNDLPTAIGGAWDVVADPGNSSRYYVLVAGQNSGSSTTGSGLYMGTNLGSKTTTTWKRISDTDSTAPVTASLPYALAATQPSPGRLAVGSTGRLFVAAFALGHPVYLGYTSDQGQHWTRMETPRFPKRPGDAPIAIKQVTRTLGSAVILVEAMANHDLDTGGNGRVRIAGVSGFPTANGDWRVGSFTEAMANSPSTTKFTLQDRFSGAEGDGTSGQQAGTGGTLVRWDDVSGNGQTNNVALVVDPTSSDIVYLAGDHDSGFAEDLTKPSGQGQAANIVRGDATNTSLGQIPTQQWTFITGTFTTSSTTPHGDVRDMAFNGKNELILSSDGGVFLHPNPRGKDDWVNLNGDMNGLEMHDVAFDPLAKILTGSNQDNGVPEQPATGNPAWTVLQLPDGNNSFNGDGGDVQSAIESSDATKSLRIVSSVGFGNVMLREFQKVGTQVNLINGPTILPFTVAAGDGSAPGSIYSVEKNLPFITPFLLNSQNTNRLVVAANANVWESTDLGQTVAIVPGGPQGGQGFAYGHPADQNALWVAAGSGVYYRLGANAQLTKSAGFSGSARAVVMSPQSPASAYATSDQRVYFTADVTASDGGVPWIDVTGDLSTLANNDGPGELRAIVYISSPTTGDRIVVAAANATTSSGSEKGVPGVFMMAVANRGVWTRIGSNLPNASVYDLVYDAPNDRLYVATAGRGVWSVSNIRQADRAPIALCRPVAADADGTCRATVAPSAVNNGSSDPDGGGVTLSLAPAGPFPPGSTPVTLTVTDSQGASATCQTTVTVTDRILPVIGTNGNITRTLCDSDGESVTLTAPAASDNCGPPIVTGTVIASSDPRFPVPTTFTGTQITLGAGTYTVRWTASDGTNSASTTQTVTIRGGVFATSSADLRDGVRVQQSSGGPATLLNSGTGNTHLGVHAQTGDVLSRGPVRLDDRAVVTTIARSAGTVSQGNQVVVPTVLMNAPMTFPAPYSVTAGAFGTTPVNVARGVTKVLAPGSYGNVTVYAGGRLNLSTGVYRFTGFDFEPQAILGLAQASGPIQIQAQSSLIWRGTQTLMSGTIAGFTLAYFGTSIAPFEAAFTGVLVAPNAQATLGTDTVLTFGGQFYVKSLVATPNTVIVCREDVLP
jgi:hypothetical protein